MDEAGGHSYARPDKSRFFVRSAVLISESNLIDYQVLISELCRDNPHNLPFHSHLIFHGQRAWASKAEQQRKQLLHEMADVICENDIQFVFGCVDKQGMVRRYVTPYNPHIFSFVQCGEMVEGWMRLRAPNQHWIPCVGATDHNKVVEEMFLQCRKSGAPFGRNTSAWRHVADVMAFTSPDRSKLFALADLCAFCVSRSQQKKEHWGLWDKLRGKLAGCRYFPT